MSTSRSNNGTTIMQSSRSLRDNGDGGGDDDEDLDITAMIQDCASNCLSLQDPFLTNPDSFQLHDAMAASQLMDAKMDSCEIPADQVAPWNDPSGMIFPRPIPTGLDDPMTPLPWEELSMEGAAVILLEILVRLQSLVSGSSVGESTFTVLYAHSGVLYDMLASLLRDDADADADVAQVEENIAKILASMKLSESRDASAAVSTSVAKWSVFASTLALVEITETIRNIVINADIYEEEDFSVNTYNITFFTASNTCLDENGVSTNPSQALLNTCEVLQFALKKVEGMSQRRDVSTVTQTTTTMVKMVLQFQLDLLSLCSSLAQLSCASIGRKVLEAQVLSRNIAQNLRALREIAEDYLVDGYSESAKETLQQTFDSFVTRPLVGNLPIRKIHFQTPMQAIALLDSAVTEIDTFVCTILLRATSLGRLQRMLDRVSSCNILSRSLLVLNLYFDDKLLGQYSVPGLLSEDMCRLQQAPERLFDSSERSRVFLNRLAKPYYDTLKLRLLNRNRQRAYIEAVLLPDWANLHNEAKMVDTHLHQQLCSPQQQLVNVAPPTFFTRYTITIMLHLMDRYIASGVAVGLFQNNHHDISFAFWYRDFLLSALNQNLSLMRQTKEAEARCSAAEESASLTARHKGKKKHPKTKLPNGRMNKTHPNNIPPPPPTVGEVEDIFELKIIALKRNLCRKTIQFLAALTQTGVLREQQYEFTSLERIFEKRFEVFRAIRQPPHLSYQSYLEGNDFSRIEPSDLLHTIAEGFQVCRSSADQLLLDTSHIDAMYASAQESELKALIKVCIGNLVYVQKLRLLYDAGESDEAKAIFDFGTHDEFCIIKVS
jgi:Mak10 subunit, NatC N(alpha)-terminal acetyltransferase